MITVDWANYEETVIILRIVGACSKYEWQLVSLQYNKMMMASTTPLDLMVDIRMGQEELSKILLFLRKELNNSRTNLNKVILLIAPDLLRSRHIIDSFYPDLTSKIFITESVDAAYGFVVVA